MKLKRKLCIEMMGLIFLALIFINIKILHEFERIDKEAVKLDVCPYCKQEITDTLISTNLESFKPMSIKENIQHIDQQIEMANILLKKSIKNIKIKEGILINKKKYVENINSKIRHIKDLLIESELIPDTSELRKKIEFEDKIKNLEAIRESFHKKFKKMQQLIRKYQVDLNKLDKFYKKK